MPHVQKRVENNINENRRIIYYIIYYIMYCYIMLYNVYIHHYSWMCAKPRKNVHISDIFLMPLTARERYRQTRIFFVKIYK